MIEMTDKEKVRFRNAAKSMSDITKKFYPNGFPECKPKKKRAISLFGRDYPKKRYPGYVCTACKYCKCIMHLKDRTWLTAPKPNTCPWGTGYPAEWKRK